MKKPSMYYWTTDSFNREWRLLVEGEYEEYEDGNEPEQGVDGYLDINPDGYYGDENENDNQEPEN